MSKTTILQHRVGKSILGKGIEFEMKTPAKLDKFHEAEFKNSNSAKGKDYSLIETHFGIKVER